MSRSLIVHAPGKLNLHLSIVGVRPDGYHELRSLFHRIDLEDTITIRIMPGKKRCEIRGDFPFPARHNIISRAYNLFRDYTGITDGVKIDVEKRIPMGGGLGGGSSDAAATLEGLNRLFQAGLSGERLTDLGASLGSDVPFFFCPEAAWVTGRGETITPIRGRSDLGVILATPMQPVGTGEAFSWLDDAVARKECRYDSPQDESPEPWKALYKSPREWRYSNTFMPVIMKRLPVVKVLVSTLENYDADFVGLSGSGSTVFGVYEEADKVHRIAEMLKDMPGIVYRTGKLLARTP